VIVWTGVVGVMRTKKKQPSAVCYTELGSIHYLRTGSHKMQQYKW